MPGPLETLAYALARGAVRAYLDELAARSLVVDEVPSLADLEKTRRFAAAVQRMRELEAGRASGPVDPAPGGPRG